MPTTDCARHQPFVVMAKGTKHLRGVQSHGALAAQLSALAHSLGGHALLIDEHGEVLCHALGATNPPHLLVEAILSRSLGPGLTARHRPRTLGVLADGVVIRWEHDAFPRGIVSLPLASPAAEFRRHLLLLNTAERDLATLSEAAAVLTGSLPAARSVDDEVLRAALSGSASLPAWMVDSAAQVRVLRVRGSGPPHLLEWALVASIPSAVGVVRDGDEVEVVVRETGDNHREAHAAITAAEGILGSEVAGALSDAGPVALPLHRLREQARLAARAMLLDGTCRLARDLRARATLLVLQEQLDTIDIWEDPTQLLLEGPLGEQLGLSVLAWLEANGDVAAAARAMGLHPNTLRYRLKRAEKAISAPLDDPDVRLELHLRLRRRLTGRTPTPAVRSLEVV